MKTPLSRNQDYYIPPLTSEPSLCPVRAIQLYLSKTPNARGALFRSFRDHQKVISVQMIRDLLSDLISTADPEPFLGPDNKKPSVHSIRAYASSILYFKSMNFDELTPYTGWKGPAVFFKHYLKDIEHLGHDCIVLGKPVAPETPPSL